jgi:hypothetical protein
VYDQPAESAAGQEPFEEHDPHDVPEGAALTSAEQDQFRRGLEQDKELRDEAQAIANSLRTPEEIEADKRTTRGRRVETSRHTLMSPRVLDEVRAPGAEGQCAGPAGFGAWPGAARRVLKPVSAASQSDAFGVKSGVKPGNGGVAARFRPLASPRE